MKYSLMYIPIYDIEVFVIYCSCFVKLIPHQHCLEGNFVQAVWVTQSWVSPRQASVGSLTPLIMLSFITSSWPQNTRTDDSDRETHFTPQFLVPVLSVNMQRKKKNVYVSSQVNPCQVLKAKHIPFHRPVSCAVGFFSFFLLCRALLQKFSLIFY